GDDGAIGFAGPSGRAFGAWLDDGKTSGDDGGARFDLVIGGQDRAGIARARERARRADVFLGITWFDLAGPYGDWLATEQTFAALNGVSYAFGEAEGPPMLAQGHAPQLTAGLVGFIASLAALLLPKGRRPKDIAVNVLEASLCLSETAALTGGTVRLGVNRYVPTYPCSAYRTKNGWVGVTCLTPAQWRSLCDLIGREDLRDDPRLATAYQRL